MIEIQQDNRPFNSESRFNFLPLKSRNKSGLFLTRVPYPKKDGNTNYIKNTEEEMIKI